MVRYARTQCETGVQDGDALRGISFLFVGVDTVTRKTGLFSIIIIRRVCILHSVVSGVFKEEEEYEQGIQSDLVESEKLLCSSQ